MTTTKMIELRNDFHNTSVRVRAGALSARTVRRVKATLCISAGAELGGCTCSGALGVRGPQDRRIVEIMNAADGTFVVVLDAR